MQITEFKSKHPTRADIHLSALKDNVKTLKKMAVNSEFLAVIKSNAYGHGIVPIGLAAAQAGADRLGITTVEEGVSLRGHEISIPIHLLSSVMPEQAEDVVTFDLTASISDADFAEALSAAAIKMGKDVTVHMKIDTGLHRFGVLPEKAIEFCRRCYHLPKLNWQGIYTHFSSADEADWDTTEKQFTIFKNVIAKLADEHFYFPIHHCGGSTITIERTDMHLDMVRPGISLFGYQPNVRQEKIASLQPVLDLKSKIVQINHVPANTQIGYGREFVTKGPSKIAVIPIGHGDGYQRALSNKGSVLVSGQRAKIVGTISLDQTLVDITHIPNVKVGDEIVLLGKQGNDEISARELAYWMGSIVDEVLAGLKERIRRQYM